jgi:two-component system C4-dicarboxylate transport sensor histidine kinase DctB
MTASPRSLPEGTVPPGDAATRVEPDSSDALATDAGVVAVSVFDVALQRELREILQGHPFVLAGHDMLASAAAVLVDAGEDAHERVADMRRLVRSDAAILVVVRTVSSARAAHAAGAFACLRFPVVAEELVGLLSSAIDSHAAKAQAADLARKLDMEAHLASIGRISSGLAHELANPVAAASLNLEALKSGLAKMGRDVSSPLEGALDDLGFSLSRIEALLASLRPFMQGAPSALRPVPVGPLVDQAIRWAEEALRGVEIERQMQPSSVLADPTMLAQLVLNLTTNAAQAARTLPSPRVRYHVYPSGGRVVLSVRDNGPGIPEHLHDKIFEPFFTTRRGRGGTGLGLALCREYARNMGAGLTLWSAPGRGACFRISLRPA